jgi:uncharacterized OsmC-like protein
MNYHISATSFSNQTALLHINESNIKFGTTSSESETLPNPAELFLGSFAACILKNVERFSGMMKFNYEKATLSVNAARLENPPRMESLVYELTIYSQDEKLNIQLLKKNIEKFGTIYNTIKLSCSITGIINKSI